ncbi:S1 family peptidase [Microbacterium sp. Leaf179]|uniref:S1 family peptidase n=2 Tax=unclassified Microbacterium TaxID=2609290 RepID=UPI000A4E7745|nr:S1 family peptidase [Microbacterium sp. Leaf179]
MTRNMKRLGWAGASAAVALTASGLLAPAVAFAGEDQSTAPTTGPEFDATAQRLMTSSDQVQGVAKDGSGNVVVYTTADEADLQGEAKSFVDTKSNVVVKKIDPIKAAATNDLVGGAGYLSPAGGNSVALCSVGFTGWTPQGDPAVITAGHCNADGSLTESLLSLPSGDPAGGGDKNNADIAVKAPLGTLAFSQFGGPGNTPGAEGDTSSVDIATIDVTNTDLDLLPEITDWTTASSEDLSASTTDVRAIGSAQVNQPASKSGRTTGLTTGNVTGVEGWMRVAEENDVRWVYGFAVEGDIDTVQGGDSGGAVFQGTTAVGVVSGGNETGTFLWAADLQAGLARTDGYSVAVKVDAPALTTPADGGTVGVGGAISGTAPAGTTLKVTPEGGDTFDVAVDGSGNWSFTAPDKLGTFSFSLRAVNGFNKSASVDASVEVKAEAPVITSPANGSTVENEVTSISGTGLAGATVTLAGDAKGSAKVAADGTWSVTTDLAIGTYSVTATQARDGQTSAEATSSFTVAPSAPTITGIQDGASYSGAAIPTSVSGTGVNGAAISVTINDAKVGETTVKDGKWSIVLKNALGEGAYAVVATQTVNSVSSSASVSFSVAAAPAPAPSPSGTPAPGGNPGNGNGNGGGGLAVTGMGDPTPLAWGAVALLLGGFGAFGYRRLRRATR